LITSIIAILAILICVYYRRWGDNTIFIDYPSRYPND
jgi:hypothetical protein